MTAHVPRRRRPRRPAVFIGLAAVCAALALGGALAAMARCGAHTGGATLRGGAHIDLAKGSS